MGERRLLIGIDGGGTKTAVALADLSGEIVARSTSDAANVSSDGLEAALAAIDGAIAAAVTQLGGRARLPAAVAAGIAGVDRPSALRPMSDALNDRFPSIPCRVVMDPELVLEAAVPAGPAIALIAGTGSIAVGRDATGRLVRAGGWGPAVGDEGSGYAIGLAALRAILQAHDRRSRPTDLAEPILTRLAVSRAPVIVDRLVDGSISRRDIAALASIVAAVAATGDPTAASIIDAAARDLGAAVHAVAKRIPGGSRLVPLAMGGGLIVNIPGFADAVVAEARARGALVGQAIVVPDPIVGAIRMAQRLAEAGVGAQH